MEYKNIKNIAEIFFAKRDENDNINNELIINAWNESPVLFLKLLYFMRDSRTGRGEKQISYLMMCFLKNNFPKTYKLNIEDLSLNYGCIKDLLIMSKYNITDDSVKGNYELNILASMLKEDVDRLFPTLAVKWAPREKSEYKEQAIILSKILFPNSKNNLERYRKEIINVLNKKIDTVETKMCKNKWNEIEYSQVPYLALKKYYASFLIHDSERFNNFIENKKRNKILNKNIKKYKYLLNNKKNCETKIIDLLNNYNVKLDLEEISKSFEEITKQDLLEYLNFASKKSKKNDDNYVLLEINNKEEIEEIEKNEDLEEEWEILN